MKLSRRAALLGGALATFLVFSLNPSGAQGQSAAPELTPEKVKTALPALEKFIGETLQKTGVPGLSVAVVYKDEVVYLKGFGVREVGKPEKVDPDTVFQLASMSKPISGTVVAALVSEGVVSWSDPIVKYYPEFALHTPYVTQEVTIRDMFCHRSGLPGNSGNDLEDAGFSRPEILRRLRYVAPASSFRAGYAYSNFGITTGGVAAARAAGKEWEDVAAEKLYRPLGMASTSSRYADFVGRTNRAHLHIPVGGKWAAKGERHPDAQAPAGGVSSNVRDLAQWVRLELAGGVYNGKRLISAAALSATHEPLILRGENLATGGPGFYGLGWNIDYDEGGRILWGHAGAFSQGARTNVLLSPSENLGIVVLTNAFPTGVPDAICNAFFDLARSGRQTRDWVALWDGAYQQLVQMMTAQANIYAKPPANPAPALPLSAYVGEYRNDYVGTITIRQVGNALELQIGPKKKSYPLRHWNRDVFLYPAAPELPTLMSGVTFLIEGGGSASQVTIDTFSDVNQGVFARVPVSK